MWTGTAGVVIGSIVQVFVDRRIAVPFFLCYTTSCCFCIFSIIYMVSLSLFRIAAFLLFGTDSRKRSPSPSVLSALLTCFPGRCAAQGRIQGRIPGMDFYRMDIFFSPFAFFFLILCFYRAFAAIFYLLRPLRHLYQDGFSEKTSLPLLLRTNFTFVGLFFDLFSFLWPAFPLRLIMYSYGRQNTLVTTYLFHFPLYR